MQVARFLPPMDTFGGRVRTWDLIRDDLFGGALSETLYTPHFVGLIEGEFAGSLGYYVPADTRDVGIVEFVAPRTITAARAWPTRSWRAHCGSSWPTVPGAPPLHDQSNRRPAV